MYLDLFEALAPEALAIPEGTEMMHPGDGDEPLNGCFRSQAQPARVGRIDEGMADRLDVRRQLAGRFFGGTRTDGKKHRRIDTFARDFADADHRVPVSGHGCVPAYRRRPLQRHRIAGRDVGRRPGPQDFRP